MKNKQKERVESLYSLKAISSFFVVAIHSSVYGQGFFSTLFGMGTLCFLAITGWLLYSENAERVKQKCIKWSYKLFKLAIIVTIVYLLELVFLETFFSGRGTPVTYYSFIIRDSITRWYN